MERGLVIERQPEDVKFRCFKRIASQEVGLEKKEREGEEGRRGKKDEVQS